MSVSTETKAATVTCDLCGGSGRTKMWDSSTLIKAQAETIPGMMDCGRCRGTGRIPEWWLDTNVVQIAKNPTAEITPEMIEAGAGILLGFRWDRHDADKVAAQIFMAMCHARP